MLKASILKAREDKVWVHHKGSLTTNSVLFWVEQTVLALEELDRAKQDKLVSNIVGKFTKFLINLVKKEPCYLDWCGFKGIFPRLAAIHREGADSAKIDEGKLLEELANTPADGDKVPNIDGVSVFVSASFFGCPLYHSFVTTRA